MIAPAQFRNSVCLAAPLAFLIHQFELRTYPRRMFFCRTAVHLPEVYIIRFTATMTLWKGFNIQHRNTGFRVVSPPLQKSMGFTQNGMGYGEWLTYGFWG
jgi:hypothetical protein